VVKALQQQRFHQMQLQMHKVLQAVVVLMQETVHRLLIAMPITVVTVTIGLKVCSNRTTENGVVEAINSSQHNSSNNNKVIVITCVLTCFIVYCISSAFFFYLLE
jgi:hypothetical protein